MKLTEKFQFKQGIEKVPSAPPQPYSVTPNERHFSPQSSVTKAKIQTRTDQDGYLMNAIGRNWSSQDLTPEVKNKNIIPQGKNNNSVDKLIALNSKLYNKNTKASKRKV